MLDAGRKELSAKHEREREREHESLELLDEYWVPLTVACTELPSRAMLRLRWRDPKKPPA